MWGDCLADGVKWAFLHNVCGDCFVRLGDNGRVFCCKLICVFFFVWYEDGFVVWIVM